MGFKLKNWVLKFFGSVLGTGTKVAAQGALTAAGNIIALQAWSQIVTHQFDQIAAEWEQKAKQAMDELKLIEDEGLRRKIGESVGTFQRFREWGAGVVKAFGSVGGWITLTAVAAEALAIYETAFNWFLSQFGEFWDPEHPHFKRDAREKLQKWLSIQRDFQRVVNVLAVLGSHSVYGNALGLDVFARLLNNVSWALGIGWLSWIAIGPGMRFTLAQPLEKLYRERLRPEEFTRELVTRFLRKRIISVEDAREILAGLGWSDDKIEKLIEDAWSLPSRENLQDLYEDKIITDERLNEWFTKLGVHPEIREDMLTLTKKRATSSVLRSYISAVESNYLKGYRDYEFLKNAYNLTISNVNTDDLRALTIAEKDFGERNDERVKTVVEAFRDGTIDEDTFRAQLSEIIVRPEVLENLVALEKQRKQPKVRVEPSQTLERRERTLENRLEILQIQYEYQSKLREQDLAVMDARINRVRTRYDAEIERVKRLAEIRAETILEEANISAGYDVERAEARIRELTAVTEAQVSRLQAELDAIIKALQEEFETYRAATVYEVEARIRYWQVKLAEASPTQRPIIEAKIQLLQELAALSVVEREQRTQTIIERYKARYNARIEEIKARLEARITFLRETAGLSRDEALARAREMAERIGAEAEERVRELEKKRGAELKELEERRKKLELQYERRLKELETRIRQTREELEDVRTALQAVSR